MVSHTEPFSRLCWVPLRYNATYFNAGNPRNVVAPQPTITLNTNRIVLYTTNALSYHRKMCYIWENKKVGNTHLYNKAF